MPSLEFWRPVSGSSYTFVGRLCDGCDCCFGRGPRREWDYDECIFSCLVVLMLGVMGSSIFFESFHLRLWAVNGTVAPSSAATLALSTTSPDCLST